MQILNYRRNYDVIHVVSQFLISATLLAWWFDTNLLSFVASAWYFSIIIGGGGGLRSTLKVPSGSGTNKKPRPG